MRRAERNGVERFVAGCAGAQLSFVRDLCNENSYTYNPGGTNRVADMVLDRLGGILPHHETIREGEVGDHHILRSGRAPKAVYLVGHLDTVFPPDHPFRRCRRAGKWLVGPGTGDMKGGIAVMVYALKALAACGLLDRMSVVLMLSADEEVGAVTSAALFNRERRKASACIVAECGGPGGEVVISRNGKAGARLKCFGKDRHVGRGGAKKDSAILELAHKIIALEGLNDYLPGVSLNVGTIEGGLGPCTVPGRAECLLDIRWTDEKHFGKLRRRIDRILTAHAQPGSRCEMTLLNRRPAMPLTPASKQMFDDLRRVAGSVGLDIRGEHRRGTSDANHFGATGVPTLDGFGPVCEDDHTEKERILISSLRQRTLLLALFLVEYANVSVKASRGQD
jgi:glutamate carboxypeptidase